MFRCLQLAGLGAGYVAPNPMVGAVLVYNDRIIGEGYHKKYGQAHAEVNCIQSVDDADKHLIKDSVLYVSLEPCNHFGKTPPCTDLILRNQIRKIVIGCQDVYTKVDGKGFEKLRNNNVEIILGVLEAECKELNRRFFTFHKVRRPYIILKWAQTLDNKIAYGSDKRLLISNFLTNRLVHKWRSKEPGILIGTNTAAQDNPELTNRLWNGKSPVRLIIDLNLKLSKRLNIFKNNMPTIIFNFQRNDFFTETLNNHIYYYQLQDRANILQEILRACFNLQLQSIQVEGGRKILQSFIDENLWDETRIITNQEMEIGNGISAPELAKERLVNKYKIGTDIISIYKNDIFL